MVDSFLRKQLLASKICIESYTTVRDDRLQHADIKKADIIFSIIFNF